MVALSVGLGPRLAAQADARLVGVWERVSLRDATGNTTQPPGPAAFLILSANGYFSQIAAPVGRAKIDKPVNELTKDELVARFSSVEARRGTYRIDGDRLSRRSEVHSNPNQEGTEQVQQFRLEGDILILSSTDPKSKGEARFRRVK
jgi:hypothetical protein